jgi:hypothetical protein
MPQASHNAGDSSKKYSLLVSSGLRKPFAIGMRPNDMKGAIAALQMRQRLSRVSPVSIANVTNP